MSGDLVQDSVRLDFERLISTTRVEELEQLHDDRVQFVKKWKKFHEQLEKAFDVACPDRAPSCVAKKCQRLRQFVFHDQSCSEENKYSRLKSWNTMELSEIFGSFGLLSAHEDQIEVYENCDNEDFRKQPMTKMFYAKALQQSGRIADAIVQLEELRYNYDAHIHGEASNYLGDCFTIQYETAEQLAEQLQALQGGHFDCQKLQKRIQLYQKRFLSQEERQKGIGLTITLETVREVAIGARRKAQAAYDAHYTLTCSHEPLLRMLAFRSQERAELARKLENLDHKRRQLHSRYEQLEERIKQQTVLAKDSILSQGGLESHDYWIHSGQLEALCYGEETHIDNYKLTLKRLCSYAKGPHQLTTTITRLQAIQEIFAQEGGKDQCCSVIGHLCDFIRVGMSRLKEKGSANIDDLLGDAVKERPSEWVAAEETVLRHLFEQSFNMRGMVCAPRPFLIPGGLSLVGGRVPDIIFSPADHPIFEKLLQVWQLDTVAPDNALEFCDRLIDHLRSVFSTHRLQRLHSKEHEQFDTTSDACIQMMGIPPEMRKGTNCCTNCSSALLFIGDCREHAFEMCAFFDFWQKMNINKLLLSAYQALESSVEEMIAKNTQVSQQIHSILASQLRGGHVGIYSSVRMVEKYKPVGWDNNDPLIYRPYNRDSLLNKEPLSEYELRNSFLVVHYHRNQTAENVDSKWSHVKVILPQWDSDLQEEVIPHSDGVPTVFDLGLVESVELFNLVEEHTTTFLVRTCSQGKKIIQCKDAFYNERYNTDDAPESQICHYRLGNQELDADDVVAERSLCIGTWALLHEDDGSTQQHEIRIRLLPHSRRTDTEHIRGDPHRIHFMGMELNNLEVVGELLREEKTRATGQPSRRDLFLDRLYRYGKEKKAGEKS